jgi:cytochrome P450
MDYLKRVIDERAGKLSTNLVLSNSVALIRASFIASASLLSWLIYMLVEYPTTQERLWAKMVEQILRCREETTFARL